MIATPQEALELELPWRQGAGSYQDACRIEATGDRRHPQAAALGVNMRTRTRIAHVVETRAGQGARTSAFIVRACNSYHALEAIRGALLGAIPEAPEIGPLSWLKSALDELKLRGPDRNDQDPQAFWEMVQELETFRTNALAALAAAAPAQPDTETPGESR